jgi:hypothetical protein
MLYSPRDAMRPDWQNHRQLVRKCIGMTQLWPPQVRRVTFVNHRKKARPKGQRREPVPIEDVAAGVEPRGPILEGDALALHLEDVRKARAAEFVGVDAALVPEPIDLPRELERLMDDELYPDVPDPVSVPSVVLGGAVDGATGVVGGGGDGVGDVGDVGDVQPPVPAGPMHPVVPVPPPPAPPPACPGHVVAPRREGKAMAKPRAKAGPKNENPRIEVYDTEGYMAGTLCFNLVANSLDVWCGTHGEACHLNRTLVPWAGGGRQGQGRPFGLCAAWMLAGKHCTAAEHRLMKKGGGEQGHLVSHERRLHSRLELESRPDIEAWVLASGVVERALRVGEGPEPIPLP